jgi:hypothetical protein
LTPEIIPGEYRNDFYVTLDSCEVTQERTTPTARNLEVVARVRLDSGPFLNVPPSPMGYIS